MWRGSRRLPTGGQRSLRESLSQALPVCCGCFIGHAPALIAHSGAAVLKTASPACDPSPASFIIGERAPLSCFLLISSTSQGAAIFILLRVYSGSVVLTSLLAL